MPNFDEVVSNREIRALRHSRPYQNLREAVDQCEVAGKDFLDNAAEGVHSKLLQRSIIITFVTYVEVYFRDMLDAIFRQCDSTYFIPKLKEIHSTKYGIEELIDIYQRQIHPLELVSSDSSFQNTDRIEKVFSKFLGKSLWGEAINLKVRLKGRPEMVVSFEPEYLDSLKKIFSLRHELVHNPRQDFTLSAEVLRDLNNADGLLLAVDIVLLQDANRPCRFRFE